MLYKAFISYSHAADGQLAPALQSSLQRFAKPFYRLRAMRVFRDETSLHLTPQLWSTIQQALRGSDNFILMASPAAAASEWVQNEINEWLEWSNGSVDKFHIVLTEGEIVWDKSTNDFDWKKTTALPEKMKGKFDAEPLYLDFRWARESEHLSLRNPKFLRGIGMLVSAINGKSLDETIGDDVKQHRVFKSVAGAAIVILTMLLAVASGAAYYANEQRKEANQQKENAIAALDRERTATENERKAKEEAETASKNEKDARNEAELKRIEAEKQTGIANEQRKEAEKQQNRAEQQTEIARKERKNAEDNAEEARRQRTEAENRGVKLQRSLSEADFQAGNQLILKNDIAGSVAFLSRSIVTNPSNSSAIDHLFNLLTIKDQPLLKRRFMPEDGIEKFDVSSDGTVIAAVLDTGAAAVWKSDNTKVQFDLSGHKAQDLQFVPNSNSIVIISDDGIVFTAKPDGEKPTSRQLCGSISRYALDQRGEKIAAACSDGKIFIVSVNGTASEPLPLQPVNDIHAISFTNEDKELSILSAGGFLRWNFSKKKADDLQEFRESLKAGEFTGIAANGTYTHTYHDPGGIEEEPYSDIFVTTENSEAKWNAPRFEFATVRDLDFNKKGDFLVVTLDRNEAHILKSDGEDIKLTHDEITNAGIHPNEKLLYTFSRDGSVNLWNAADGTPVCATLWHRQAVTGAKFASGGNFLVVRTDDNLLSVWDIRQRNSAAEKITLNNQAPTAAAVEKQDRNKQFTVKLLSEEAETAVWELKNNQTGKTLRYQHPRTDNVQYPDSLAESAFFFPTTEAFISENGKTVVTIAGDGPVLVWSTNSDKPKLKFGDDTNSNFADKVYLTAEGDRALIVYMRPAQYWRPRSSYRIFSLTDGQPLTNEIDLREKTFISDVSKDLKKLTIVEGNSAQVRDAYDFHLIGQRVEHKDRISSAVFLENDFTFSTTSRDGSLRIWDIATGFALSNPMIFNPSPPNFNGPSWDDGYFGNFPRPVLLNNGKRISFNEPCTTDDDDCVTVTQLWDISLQMNADELKQFSDLANLLYGARLGENSVIESFPQPPLSELKARFAKYEGTETDFGKLIKWLLTDRDSRRATPYSNR